jgi:hypothetical protein
MKNYIKIALIILINMQLLNKNVLSQSPIQTPLQQGINSTMKSDYIFEGKIIRQTFIYHFDLYAHFK